MKVFTIFLLLLFLGGCAVFPLPIVERPEIIGSVINAKGEPISEARVTIIGNRTVDSIIHDYEVSSVRSDTKGQFAFKKINGIDWVHGYKFLARSACSRRLEVEAEGYVSRSISLKYEGEYNHLSDNTCRNVEFNIEVVLLRPLTSQEKNVSGSNAHTTRARLKGLRHF